MNMIAIIETTAAIDYPVLASGIARVDGDYPRRLR